MKWTKKCNTMKKSNMIISTSRIGETVNLSNLNGKTSCIRVNDISDHSQSYRSIRGQTHIDVYWKVDRKKPISIIAFYYLNANVISFALMWVSYSNHITIKMKINVNMGWKMIVEYYHFLDNNRIYYHKVIRYF